MMNFVSKLSSHGDVSALSFSDSSYTYSELSKRISDYLEAVSYTHLTLPTMELV